MGPPHGPQKPGHRNNERTPAAAPALARGGWFSPTSLPDAGWDGGSGYITSAPALVATYLPGRGQRANKKVRGLGQWPTLHLVGALVNHLPKWESGRHNL
ncbi:hypothetical protein BS78_01G296300 [Paspalum vaginatum]|nr:hypothetical protein BS78_01G296300 [Paspalum vaginatum]